jgi:uncharacterized membrane protein
VYDAVCQLFGFRKNGELIVGVLMLGVVTFASWLACHWFAGRAAFLLVGAMIATAMSANVFFWIIPGQRKVVAAMTSDQPYDAKAMAIHGKRGKQRSVHNTYFTLPVIFAMLSNHYSFTYTHPQNWVILVLMMFAGAAIRQYFVMRHAYHHGRSGNPWPYAAVGIAVIVSVIVWLGPKPSPVAGASAVATATVAIAPAEANKQAVKDSVPAGISKIIEQRCVMCHGAQVQMKNVRLDSTENLQKNKAMVYQQVVVTKQMPMNNSTGITPEERQTIAEWAKP